MPRTKEVIETEGAVQPQPERWYELVLASISRRYDELHVLHMARSIDALRKAAAEAARSQELVWQQDGEIWRAVVPQDKTRVLIIRAVKPGFVL